MCKCHEMAGGSASWGFEGRTWCLEQEVKEREADKGRETADLVW